MWTLCGLIALSIFVTYSREPHEKLYNVTSEGLSLGPVVLAVGAAIFLVYRRTLESP